MTSRKPAVTALALIAAALLSTAALVSSISAADAQQPGATALGIDADTTDNTATALGRVDSCASMRTGDTHEVDIYITDVTELLAWELPLEYDPEVIEVVGRDVELLQAANEGSAVQDVSEVVPDDDGRYELAAFDSADPATPDSGSGTLARVTVKAVGPGVSPLTIALTDLNGDGAPDRGPFLRGDAGAPIGDENGDTLFDGEITSAQIAVDESCSGAPLPDSAPDADEDSDGTSTTLIVALAAGGAAILVILVLAALRLRRRSQP